MRRSVITQQCKRTIRRVIISGCESQIHSKYYFTSHYLRDCLYRRRVLVLVYYILYTRNWLCLFYANIRLYSACCTIRACAIIYNRTEGKYSHIIIIIISVVKYDVYIVPVRKLLYLYCLQTFE